MTGPIFLGPTLKGEDSPRAQAAVFNDRSGCLWEEKEEADKCQSG